MSELQRQLQHMAMARRMEIIPHVYHSTQGTVHTGPFAGMKIVPKVSWALVAEAIEVIFPVAI